MLFVLQAVYCEEQMFMFKKNFGENPSSPSSWTWKMFLLYWSSSGESSFHSRLSQKCQNWSSLTYNLKMKLIPKANKQVTNKPLFFRWKAMHMLDVPAAMVIAQTALQQQHINPSWPSILTCDKRGGRPEGGAPFLSNAPHIWVPGHQQALESPRSLGMLYSCRGREKERRGKRRGGRGALSLKDNVWSRLETCGHWMKWGLRKKQRFHTEAPSKPAAFGFLFVFHSM